MISAAPTTAIAAPIPARHAGSRPVSRETIGTSMTGASADNAVAEARRFAWAIANVLKIAPPTLTNRALARVARMIAGHGRGRRANVLCCAAAKKVDQRRGQHDADGRRRDRIRAGIEREPDEDEGAGLANGGADARKQTAEEALR